ncbi:MAG: DUF1499 domain-containing protein [Methylococcaceae bacterium]
MYRSIQNFRMMSLLFLFSTILMTQPAIGRTNRTQLPPCPASPNCVSSQADEGSHRVDPFKLAVPFNEAWQTLRATLKEIERTSITGQTENYLHAEVTSLIFRFVDDFEFLMDESKQVIHVRSASRTGHSDFGVNRKRVENLRQKLKGKGVIL